MAVGAAEGDRYVVTHHLGADHRQGFDLGRIDLARHNGGSWLVGGNDQFSDAGARPGGKQADVIGDLGQANGELFKGTVGFDNAIVGGQRLELVGGRDEGMARQFSDVFGHHLGIALGRIQPGSHSGAAECKFGEMGQGVFKRAQAVIKLGNVAGEFLTKSEGGCVHPMGAADLDHLAHGFGLGGEGVAELADFGNSLFHQELVGRNVHRCGEGVVGGL